MATNLDFEKEINNVVQIKVKGQDLPTHGKVLSESLKYLCVQMRHGDNIYIRKSNIISVFVDKRQRYHSEQISKNPDCEDPDEKAPLEWP